MASIKMCDFCGKVSNLMAAEIYIRPVGGFRHADVLSERAQQLAKHNLGVIEDEPKDCCEDCFLKFNQPRTLKVLEASDDL